MFHSPPQLKEGVGVNVAVGVGGWVATCRSYWAKLAGVAYCSQSQQSPEPFGQPGDLQRLGYPGLNRGLGIGASLHY